MKVFLGEGESAHGDQWPSGRKMKVRVADDDVVTRCLAPVQSHLT